MPLRTKYNNIFILHLKSIFKSGIRGIDKLRPLEYELSQRGTEHCDIRHFLTMALPVWFSSGNWKCSGAMVVLKNESSRTISNRFLVSLCVADFLVGLVIDPVWIAIRFSTQPQRAHILKQVINLLWIHATAATVFNLCCVSVDRFLAIRFPFRHQDILTKKRCLRRDYNGVVNLTVSRLPFSRILVDNRTNIESLWFSLTFITFVLPITVVSLCYFFHF